MNLQNKIKHAIENNEKISINLLLNTKNYELR